MSKSQFALCRNRSKFPSLPLSQSPSRHLYLHSDVAYILGYARNNEELRFSLRSIDKNLKHDGVILSGFPPGWTQNTARLSVQAKGSARKFLNAARNMLAICQ